MELSFYTNFAASLVQQEAQINTLQQQVSTGLAVQSPDQNPAAFEAASLGQDQLDALTNDNNTQASIQVQLGSVNNAYQSVGSLLNSVQTAVEQALNGTTSADNMHALAEQVQAAGQELVSLGNQTSANGTYLFGGSRGTLAPFQTNASGTVVYMGDGGQSQSAITPDTTASTIANGDVFTSTLNGDGTASITANAANTGAGQVLSQGVVSAPAALAFQQGSTPITISFSSDAQGNTIYTAAQGGTTLATGTYSGSVTLQLAGSDYEITGAPDAGDQFTLTPSRPQTVFALMQGIYNTLAGAGSTPAQVAQKNQALNQALAGITQYQAAFVTAQAQNGVTLQALTISGTNNTNQATQVQTNVNNVTQVNMPAAITQLDQMLTATQAAMKSFGNAQSLSLFQYI